MTAPVAPMMMNWKKSAKRSAVKLPNTTGSEVMFPNQSNHRFRAKNVGTMSPMNAIHDSARLLPYLRPPTIFSARMASADNSTTASAAIAITGDRAQ